LGAIAESRVVTNMEQTCPALRCKKKRPR